MIMATQLCYSTSTPLLCYDRSQLSSAWCARLSASPAGGGPLAPGLSTLYSWTRAATLLATRGNDAGDTAGPSDDALREETIDQLIVNYGHGKLSLEAFERRLDEALDAQSHDRLLELTKDLDLRVDRQYAEQKTRGAWHPRRAGRKRPQRCRRGRNHDQHLWRQQPRRAMGRAEQYSNAQSVRRRRLGFQRCAFHLEVTKITMLCVFGGVDLRVREGVRTVSKAVCIFGGVDNRGPSAADRNAPTIVPPGSRAVRRQRHQIKKTAKERWLEFANTVKEMLAPVAEKTKRPSTRY